MSFVFPRAAYAARIGLDALPRTAPGSLSRLRQMMAMHTQHIPFETIDALLQRPIPLDMRSVCTKLVHARRGGYCFEQNMLLEAALRDAGFAQLHIALARVLWGDGGGVVEPTHAFVLVRCRDDDADVTATLAQLGRADATATAATRTNGDNNNNSNAITDGGSAPWWIADVGFGACLTQGPLLLDVRAPQQVPGGTFRVLRHEAGECGDDVMYTVQLRTSTRTNGDSNNNNNNNGNNGNNSSGDGERWKSMYRLTTRPQPVDVLQQANDFVMVKPVFSENIMGMSVRGAWRDDGVTYVQHRVCSLRNNVVTIKPGYSTASPSAATTTTQHHHDNNNNNNSDDDEDEAAAAARAVAADLSAPVLRKHVHTCRTPEEFYHCLKRHLDTQLDQTAYPSHTVTCDEFCRAARAKLAVFADTTAKKGDGDGRSAAKL